MCVAVAAKVIEILENGNRARVSVNGNEMEINCAMVSAAVDDFVLVHAGCAVERIKESAADEIMAIYRELEEITQVEA